MNIEELFKMHKHIRDAQKWAYMALMLSSVSLFVSCYNLFRYQRNEEVFTMCKYHKLMSGVEVVKCENKIEICFIDSMNLSCKRKKN